MEETEVITRMNWVLHCYKLWSNLDDINWNVSTYVFILQAKFKDIGLDSLDSTAVITSLEHEFHIVFEDKVFDNIETLNHVKRLVLTDHNAF